MGELVDQKWVLGYPTATINMVNKAGIIKSDIGGRDRMRS
jgi:hypothetical protein